MNEIEHESTFRRLAETLREVGLEWLVAEVFVEIRRGKPQPKKVKVQSFHEYTLVEDEPVSIGRKPAMFVESVEFTPSEKVDILISAIERALVAPCVMETQVANILTKTTKYFGSSAESVDYKFVAEGETLDSRTSTDNERVKRTAFGDSLSGTINKLRKVTHGAN